MTRLTKAPLRNYLYAALGFFSAFLFLRMAQTSGNTITMLALHCLGFSFAFGALTLVMYLVERFANITLPANAFSRLFNILSVLAALVLVFAYLAQQALRPPVNLGGYVRYNDISHFLFILFLIPYALFPMRLVYWLRFARGEIEQDE